MLTRTIQVFLSVFCAVILFTSAAHGQTRTEDAKLDPSDIPVPPDNIRLFFGWRVALDGDFAAVGAPRERRNRFTPDEIRDEGAVYVYRNDMGDWSEEAKLTPHFEPLDYRRVRLGSNVAISGDTIIGGASRDAANGPNAGAAFVYRRDPGMTVCGQLWCSEGKLLPDDGNEWEYFGNNLAVDGDTAYIGSSSGNIGAVYVFTRSGATWSQQAKILPPTDDQMQNFGNGVVVSGDTMLIGANGDSTPVPGDPTDFTNAGAAYIYTNVAGTWTFHSKLQASDRRALDQFGTGIALDGDIAVIGAPRRFSSVCNGGAAYIFERVADVWQEQTKILSPNGLQDDCFGFLAAVSGNTVILPADLEDTPGTDAGAAYVYAGSGTDWNLLSRIGASDAQEYDAFGFGVAIDGNTTVLGAPTAFTGFPQRTGSAYVYELDQVETPVGIGVEVNPLPLDEEGNPAPDGPSMTLEFGEVTAAGSTTVSIVTNTEEPPPVPPGFRVGGLSGEPAFFDIQTDAEFTPPVTICIDYSGLALEGDPADLRFFHDEGGEWVDITISNELVEMVICGDSFTFSFFAVFGAPSADALLADLSDALALLDAGDGTINSLMSKLAATQAKIADGNTDNDSAALSMLNAFLNAVEAQRGKKITDAEADLLVQQAQEIMLVIGG